MLQSLLRLNKKTVGIVVCLLFSIFFTLYSLFLHFSIDFLSVDPMVDTATVSWLISIITFTISITLLSFKRFNTQIKITKIEWTLLGVILCFASFLRLYKLEHQPIYLDEWFWLTNAKGILTGIIKSPFGFIGDQPSNMPAYIVAVFLAITKNSYFAVRLPGILYSLLNIVFVFFLLIHAIGKKAAFASAVLIATSIWDIHMSQLGWNNVNLNPFLISGSLLFLFLAVKYKSKFYAAVTGIFLGTSMNLLYIAALDTLVVLPLFFLMLAKNKLNKQALVLFFIVGVSFIVTSAPTIPKIIKYSKAAVGRHEVFLEQNLQNADKTNSKLSYYGHQFAAAVSDFFYQDEKYDIVMLWGITIEPAVSIVCLLGLLYILFSLKQNFSCMVITNFILMFIPVVILYRFTSIWREYSFLPSIYIFSGIGFALLSQTISHMFRKKSAGRNVFVTLIVLYLLTWSIYFKNYYNTFLRQEPAMYETNCRHIADYVNANIKPGTLLLLSDELCTPLISTLVWDHFPFATYHSYDDIINRVHARQPFAIVKISQSYFSNTFDRENPPILFENKVKTIFLNIKSNPIKDKTGKIDGVIYIL